MGANTATVQKLYVAFFNRPGDVLGQAFWEGKMDAGMTEAQVAASFAQSTEYTSVYGSLTTAQTVSTLYTNLFGRSAAASEITFWGLRLLNGQETVASIARTLANSAQGTDATAIANKVTAATSFTNALTTTDQIVGYSGTAANAVAKAWLATVTDVATTLTAATTSLSATITSATTAGAASTGSTFTFTTGVDTLTGTNANDTFVADNTGTTKQLTVADTISGGSGTDTLKVYNAAADAIDTQSFGTLSSIETLYINNGALTNTKTFDASALTGVTSVTLDSPAAMADSAAFTVKTGSTQSLALTKVIGTTGGATSTLTLDGASNLTVNGVGTDITLDLKSTGTSLNVTTTGAASTFSLTNTGAKLATLNIAGDKNLTLTENLANLVTINASSATGKVAVDTSAGTAASTLAFTGGSGNDTLTMAASATVKTQVLDGGAGTDTLAIKDVSITSGTTALNQGINAVKNFEILGFAGGASLAADVSQITSISQFDVTAAIVGTAGAANSAATNAAPNTTGGTVGASFTGQTNAASFIIDANVTGGAGGANAVAYTGAATGGAGAAGLKIAPTIDNASNAVSLTLSGVTITGGAGGNSANATTSNTGGAAGSAVDLSAFETVNIVSNTDAAGTGTTNTLTAGAAGTGATANGAAGYGLMVGANATINVSGAANMTMGAIYSGTGATPNNNVTLNAGSLTGNLSATLGTGNDTIVGGSGTNTISLGGGIDTVNLTKSTAKADVITLNAVGTVDAKAGQLINITGFTDSAVATVGDKIVFGNAASLIGAVAANTINGGSSTALTTTINSGSVATFSGAGSAVTLNTYIDGVFTAMNSAGNKVAAFEYNGDTYLVQDNGTGGAYNAASDLVVKLVGVTGVTSVSTAASGAAAIFVA